MQHAWAWLKKWGAWIGGILLAVVGVGWLWHKREELVGRLKDELAVEKAMSDVARLDERRTILMEQGDEKAEEIERIEQEILAAKRRAVEAHEHVGELSDEQVRTEAARLGY